LFRFSGGQLPIHIKCDLSPNLQLQLQLKGGGDGGGGGGGVSDPIQTSYWSYIRLTQFTLEKRNGCMQYSLSDVIRSTFYLPSSPLAMAALSYPIPVVAP
jgi:hypothetical protein